MANKSRSSSTGKTIIKVIENKTFGFNDIASPMCPRIKSSVERVMPHPGHGKWKINFEGQTTICACPSVENATINHKHTAMYAMVK